MSRILAFFRANPGPTVSLVRYVLLAVAAIAVPIPDAVSVALLTLITAFLHPVTSSGGDGNG